VAIQWEARPGADKRSTRSPGRSRAAADGCARNGTMGGTAGPPPPWRDLFGDCLQRVGNAPQLHPFPRSGRCIGGPQLLRGNPPGWLPALGRTGRPPYWRNRLGRSGGKRSGFSALVRRFVLFPFGSAPYGPEARPIVMKCAEYVPRHYPGAERNPSGGKDKPFLFLFPSPITTPSIREGAVGNFAREGLGGPFFAFN